MPISDRGTIDSIASSRDLSKKQEQKCALYIEFINLMRVGVALCNYLSDLNNIGLSREINIVNKNNAM